MHLALATPTQDAAFQVEPYDAGSLQRERLRISGQITKALDVLAAKAGTLPTEAAGSASKILAARERLLAQVDDLAGDAEAFGQRIRIHGDYHLGQLLRVRGDYLIVDFEGEPARSVEERREKQSPLKDVAGMLRSFNYAARSALDSVAQHKPEHATALEPWAALWESAISGEFLTGYRNVMGEGAALLPTVEAAQSLLRALLLEKASYELMYELNNRPAWLSIPVNGLLSIAEERG